MILHSVKNRKMFLVSMGIIMAFLLMMLSGIGTASARPGGPGGGGQQQPTSTPTATTVVTTEEPTQTPVTPTETEVTPTETEVTPTETPITPTATEVTPTTTVEPTGEFIKGFDASYVTRVEDKGGVYKTANGQTQDIFTILANNDVNYIRLRVWNDPDDGYCNKADVLDLAARAHSAGLNILIDFHYSDSWADPSQQTKPDAWSSMTTAELADAVHDYTQEVLSDLIAQGTPASMVQIGNEITHGMLWTDGYVYMDDATYDTATQWTNLATLVNAGIDGVTDAGSDAEIMVQIAGGDLDELTWFFDNIIAYGVDPDILGISYYHYWHGDFTALDGFLSELTSRYGKEVLIVETSYLFTLDWNDWTNNVLGLEEQLLDGYPATEAGQKAFLDDVFAAISSYDLGRGVFYWGGEWIAGSDSEDTDGSTWENQALFDFNGNAVQAMDVFSDY